MDGFRNTQRQPAMQNLPQGWVLINDDFLEPFREELTLDEAVAYFDGLSPTWKEALSIRVPKRAIVQETQRSLDEAQWVKRMQVTLITGPGGEGKSTIIRQVIGNMAGSYQNILWHEDVNTPFGVSLVQDLIASKETWLIASDEAERIGGEVFNAIRLLREKKKNNVHFLLCCRDTDWKGEHADELDWDTYVHYVEKPIRGLTLEDANLVVKAWQYYGDNGLGKLAGLDPFEATSRLFEQARSEAQSYIAEGSFLGAMLRVRIGAGLRSHVKNLLVRLNSRRLAQSELTLMKTFAYIVALHAKNILLLSREVLAEALNCPADLLQERALGPLGEEAAISAHGVYVLTRHRAIAETAKDIMATVFGIDFNGIYSQLLRSARKAFINGTLDVDVYYWNQLPNTFFSRGEKELGIKLAKALVEVEPANPVHVVRLSKLYREANRPEDAFIIFRETAGSVKPDGAYYHELSNLESARKRYDLSVWLDALSLSDGVSEENPDRKREMRSLCGLSTSFRKLFVKTSLHPFIEACAGAAHLGLKSNPDESTQEILRRNKAEAKAAGAELTHSKEALESVVSGVRFMWEQRGNDTEPVVPLRPANQLTFLKLARRFGIQMDTE